jgi:hypothetical protein
MRTTIAALPAQRAHYPANGARVGDHEREKVITRLGQAFTEGYLSIPEHETRLNQAPEAQTASVLMMAASTLGLYIGGLVEMMHRRSRPSAS